MDLLAEVGNLPDLAVVVGALRQDLSVHITDHDRLDLPLLRVLERSRAVQADAAHAASRAVVGGRAAGSRVGRVQRPDQTGRVHLTGWAHRLGAVSSVR